MVKNCYFVDTENVGRSFLAYLGACEDETNVYIFVGESTNRLKLISNDLNIMFESKANLRMIDCKVGTSNSMDFQISSQLGYCVHKYGKNINYYILSKDKGYEPLVWFWKQFDVTVYIVHDLSYLPGCLTVSGINFNYYVNQLNKNVKKKVLTELNNRASYFSKKNEIPKLDLSLLDNYERYLVLKRVQENTSLDIVELNHITLPEKLNKAEKKEVKKLISTVETGQKEIKEKIDNILEDEVKVDIVKEELKGDNDEIKEIEDELIISVDNNNEEFINNVDEIKQDDNANGESEELDDEELDDKSQNLKPFTLFVGTIKAASLEKKLKVEHILTKKESDLIAENQGVLRTVYTLDHSTSYVLGYTFYYCTDKKTLIKYIQRFAGEENLERLLVSDMKEIYHNIRSWDFMNED